MELNFTIGIVASLVTIIAGTASVIRYLGRAGVIEEAARRLGVDLVELVIPGEPPDGEFLHTEEATQRLRFLREHFAPVELGEALAREANHLGDEYTTSDLVELARSQVSHHALIEAAVEKPGGSPRRWQLLGEHLSDEELGSLLDKRNLWPDPIKQVAQLEDDPGNAYAWILTENATEEDRVSLRNEIESTFVEMNRAEPDSLHFIVAGIDEILELDSEVVEQYVKPWLKDRDTTEGEESK